MAFTRTQPCVLAGTSYRGKRGDEIHVHVCEGRIEANHAGPRGLSQKSHDDECFPMCSGGHRDWTDYRGQFDPSIQSSEERHDFAAREVAANRQRYEDAKTLDTECGQ